MADSAARVGKSFQEDIAPPVAAGLKQTLHTVFKKMPALVQQFSHEAHDAAKVFSKGYDKAFKEIKGDHSSKQKREDNYKYFEQVDNYIESQSNRDL